MGTKPVYVVLQPYSLSNPSAQWQVVEFGDWADSLVTDRDYHVCGSFADYGDANHRATELNAKPGYTEVI